MSRLFISHSSQDDAFVRDLRWTLIDLKQDAWIDSREMRGGDPLWANIQKALEEASAYAVVVSPAGLQSKWVADELRYALKLSRKRGRDKYPVIPLSLNGTRLGVMEALFGEEPVYIPVSSAAGGVEAALNPILVAMGVRLSADVPATPQPNAEPLEELVLELTELAIHEQDGVRRASARARLIYEPATPGQPDVASRQSWRLIAPIGPIEAEELRWYLEKYAIWPSGYFRDRAAKVVDDLKKWGRLLHDAALPVAQTANVLQAWAAIDDHAGRRFSVHVNAAPVDGDSAADVNAAREAATLLLGLPWELLHDGDAYLFQGAKPTRVRRRLPNTKQSKIAAVAAPIRILLVTARPEDDSCGYLDHRASALPLVDAMEALGGLVRIHMLCPPTLPALGDELKRAFDAREPYHVVHFDGHGVYDRRVGLGGLCFEHPDDVERLGGRRHQTVFTDELGPLLKEHRIPLVFLEACQTATAEDASESVASELLQRGVASVVAMSHSVLVETSRRFVHAFYSELARGARVGDAMLAGQRGLHASKSRGRIFGAGELILHDWFVPVLFQEKDDPQLFRSTPAPQTQEDLRTILTSRLGELPPVPDTGFIGRSRELLALERLLFLPSPRTRGEGPGARGGRYAVIRGQGGEGKTALAAEFARWMVRSQQIRRAAFVSVETHSHVGAVLDMLGTQLVGKDYSVATFDNIEKAILPIERALREQSTLLVVDNMESILEPPFVGWTPTSVRSAQSGTSTSVPNPKDKTDGGVHPTAAFAEELQREVVEILALCERLLKVGATRLIFTSREALPAPFDADDHRRELHQLDRNDAVKLVERILNAESRLSLRESASQPGLSRSESRLSDARQEQIEQLVDAVHCHARTLALLAPALRSRGVEATRASLVELMTEMEQKFPGSREKSVFASVELSLRRMTPANQTRARVLGVFHGGVNLDVLRTMMEWEKEDVASLAGELIETGLATPNRFNHLTLNPALCPYLALQARSASECVPERQSRSASECVPTGETDTDATDIGNPTILVARDTTHSLARRARRETPESLTARWVEAMRAYVRFLYQQQSQNIELAATLTVLELPNLFALLDLVQRAGDAEATIDLATSLYGLLSMLGKPRLLKRVGQVRDAAAAALGDAWSHAQFDATRTRIEQQLASGQLREAFDGAQQLLQRARAAGAPAYPNADYDLAVACFLLGRVFWAAGGSEQALPLLDEARQRFEAVAKERPGKGAERMASACITEQGSCLLYVGRLAEAAAAYEEGIRRDEQRGADRDVAVGKLQLGTVRMQQRRYPEALAAYAEARERFTQLDEPGTVAVIWHQTGMVYQNAGQPEAAEDAYRKSLAIKVRLENVSGQASTLGQLGILYAEVINRPEEAVTFYRQAADKHVEISDVAGEGRQRNNLAVLLKRLRRLDEARQEIHRVIECKAGLGHAGSVWNAWAILADIETDAGNPAAAAEAKGKAVACYLAYRRDGGENHDTEGRISLAVTQSLLAGDVPAAASLLQQLIARPDAAWLLPFLRALQAIVAGSRDRTLADDPELDFGMAAEILFLIETLEQHPPGGRPA